MPLRVFATTISALALVLPTLAIAAPRPALRAVSSLPLTLTGSGFRPGEQVRVAIEIGSLHTSRPARATMHGAFTLRLPGVRLNYCARPLSIVAHGAKTGDVRLKLPVVDCAMP
jgi:hypothetical protein